jgi:hypothetical protein
LVEPSPQQQTRGESAGARPGRRSRAGDVIVGTASALAVLAVIWGTVLVRQGHRDAAPRGDTSASTDTAR